MSQVTIRRVSEGEAASSVLSEALPHWIHLSLVRVGQLAAEWSPDEHDLDLIVTVARLARHARTARIGPDRLLRALTFMLDRAWGTCPWPPRGATRGSTEERRIRVVDAALTAYFAND